MMPPPPPPPPAIAPTPVTGGVTTPPQAGGLPGDLPPDEDAPKARLNVDASFPKVTMLKWVGIGWLAASFGLALVMNHLFMAEEPALNLVLGFGLLGGAFGMGIFAFLNEDWRKWMSYFSAFAMIGGIAARPIVTPLVTYDIVYVAPAALFAFFFFMYLEYLDAYQRFTDVARMALERNLQTFNVNQVINHFLVWGGILASVFMVGSLLMLTFVTQGLAGALGVDVQRSVEMQAVFGQAMAITVVFTLVAVVLTFLFTFLDRRTEVQQVAYSREQIREMVAQGGQPGQAGPQGPQAPGGRGAPGVPPAPRGSAPGFVERR